MLIPTSVFAATYTVSELLPTPLDSPDVVNTVSWDRTDTSYPDDDDKVLVNIGFPFTFKDVAYNQVRILTNGILHFGLDQRFHRDYRNDSLPTGEANRFIAPYWDDLVDDAQSSVTYGLKGDAPSRSFIVTWNNVRAYSNNLRYDFQVVLYENGDIRFRYANNTANGISATIGIEVDNGDFIQYSYNSSSVRTDFDLFFKNALLSLPNAVLDIRMDENEWLGDVGEVKDSSANALNGSVFAGALNANSNPPLPGNPGSCRYGMFNGSDQYINIPDNNVLDLTGSFTVSAWIKIDSLPASGLKTILSKDENYEFHVKPNGTINWWWQTVSPTATNQFDSTGVVTPGAWTHIAIRFQANNQTIFINGQASGSATFTGTPVTNNDPLQIGADQGAANREFNGDIDEVRVFDAALSDAQMVSLASATHFCSLANPGCSAAFADALSSNNDGVLNFSGTGQLVNSPDNILQFSSISPSVNTVCNGANCAADSGNPVSEMGFGSFPDTSVFNQDLSISNNQTGTLGAGGQQQFDNVVLGNGAVMNVNSAVSTYYIDTLTIGRFADVNLRPGNYWVRRLAIARDSKINVVGSGTARIFIKDDARFERNIWFNPNDNLGVTGDPSKLLIYAEGNLIFDRNIRAWAGIYSKADISLGRDSLYTGALTADNISIERNTSINYDAAAIAKLDFGPLCASGSCNLGGFDIISSPSVALACPQSRAEIGFQAMCDDGISPKTDYIGTINLSTDENALSQFYTSLSGGSPVTSISLNGTESGVGSVYLYHQNENVNLQVSLEDQVSALDEIVSIDFRSAGFAVTGPDDFVCGNPKPLTLTAIGKVDDGSSACALLTGFTGNKDLSVWVNANYEQAAPTVSEAVNSPIMINGAAISNSAPHTSTSVSVNFSLGQATVDVEHLDAAQILGVEFAYDDGVSATPELRGKSGIFVVSPDTIKVAASNNQCTANYETCDKFVSAGSPFPITATAVCADGLETKAGSYRSNGDITLALNLVAPSIDGINGALSEGVIAIQDSDNGEKTITNQKVSEVGVFTISAQAPAFFGQTITTRASANIGRFYPDYFDLSLTPASFANSCSGFTYLDQDFFFDLNAAPELTIQAKNADDVLTQNYEGDFWKLGGSLVEQTNCSIGPATEGFCYTDNLSGVASFSSANAAQSYGGINGIRNINGQKVMILHNQSFDGFNYLRSVATGIQPFDADVNLQINLEDDDGVTGSVSLNNIGFTSDSDSGGVSFNTTNDQLLRHGRWKMENAYGPETQNLAIQAHAEYFSTKNKFEFNPDDSCTALNAANISLNGGSANPVALGSGTTTFSFNSPLIVKENENFSLSAPNAGNTGDVFIEVDLTSYPWLQFDWNQDGSLEDHPRIKASFGLYRGHDRIIYWREVMN